MPEKTQGFTEDQVEDFKEVFQLFDTKGDGLIQVRGAFDHQGQIVSWLEGRLQRGRGPDSPDLHKTRGM